MKKILLLLAGQLRTFDTEHVQMSWRKFCRTFDVTIVGCFWDNRGCSLYPSEVNNPNEILSIDYVKEKLQTDYIRLFNYELFIDNLSDCFRSYRDIRYFDSSISNSFMRYQAKFYVDALNQLNPFHNNLKDFDLAICTRPDLIFLRQLPDYCFDEPNVLWHQNTHPAYYPERIYDVLTLSSVDNIFQFCNFHFDSDINVECIEKPSHNGLTKMDSSRIYYNYMQHYEIEIKSLDCHYGEPYRAAKDIQNFSQSYLNNRGVWGIE